jgi:hypothetical protein
MTLIQRDRDEYEFRQTAVYVYIISNSGICITLFRIMNMKIINNCFHPAAKEIIERGHHISIYRVHVKLP